MTEDITTELSRFHALFVIARNSSFTYKGKPIDIRQVSRELGVRYVIEGSVRKAGSRVRVSAQLIDALTGNHLWAERFDRTMDDIFAVQEEVTRAIVGAVAPEIDQAEIAVAQRASQNGMATNLTWRARSLQHALTINGTAAAALETIAAARAALAADPRSIGALLALARTYYYCHLFRWGPDPEGALAEMWSVGERMMRVAPLDDRTLTVCGFARFRRGQHQQGIAELRRSLDINPNSTATLTWLAQAEAAAGLSEAAQEHAALAIRLSPRHSHTGGAYLALAMATFCNRDYEKAIHWAEVAIQSQPTTPLRRAIKIACCARLGDVAQAAAERDVLDGFAPDFIPSLFRGANQPFKRPEDMAHLVDGLRLAAGGTA
jgi:tetratricopeptide (TPR) repeat protein